MNNGFSPFQKNMLFRGIVEMSSNVRIFKGDPLQLLHQLKPSFEQYARTIGDGTKTSLLESFLRELSQHNATFVWELAVDCHKWFPITKSRQYQTYYLWLALVRSLFVKVGRPEKEWKDLFNETVKRPDVKRKPSLVSLLNGLAKYPENNGAAISIE